MTTTPLAVRVRPTTLDEIIGQDEALAPGGPVRRLLDPRAASVSIILYAPPATGKTSVARCVASQSQTEFIELSATSAKVADVRKVIDHSAALLEETGTPAIVFIDEIHRFTKAQQDILLPAVETGTIRLIGATTENPSFQVNGALLSRSVVVQLKQLTDDDVVAVLERAMSHPDGITTDITPDAVRAIATASSGDARQALTLLETLDAMRGTDTITPELMRALMPSAVQRYDRDGDMHYDEISAFIKSMRGSDPDATLYWLARMLEGGEDPRFIARRLMIHAAEDVGIADPTVLPVAVAAAETVDRIGLPECRITLAEAALAIATAPKSNSACAGIDAAIDLVRSTGTLPVPRHLMDSHYGTAQRLYDHGVGYKYPHDYPMAAVEQQYMPEDLVGAHVWHPTGGGEEQAAVARQEAIHALAALDPGPRDD